MCPGIYRLMCPITRQTYGSKSRKRDRNRCRDLSGIWKQKLAAIDVKKFIPDESRDPNKGSMYTVHSHVLGNISNSFSREKSLNF